MVFAGKQAQLPVVKRVPWKGLHIIRLTHHPTRHRKNVLLISECPPWRVTPSSFCKAAPVLTLSPHHREQCGKSLLVRGPLEFLVPERRLSICIRFLKSFSWCARVDGGSYTTWSRDSGPKTCLSGPNSSYSSSLWAKITPPSCSKSKFQLLIKKKKKKKAQKLKWPNLFGSLFRGRRLRIQATFL